MQKRQQTGKHGPVIAIDEGKNISEEPEMKELIKVNREMTEGEKTRTAQYLNDKDRQGVKPKEVIQ